MLTSSCTILSVYFSSPSGTVFVTNTLSNEDFLILSIAGPENSPCVINAITFVAPWFFNSFAAVQSVPCGLARESLQLCRPYHR